RRRSTACLASSSTIGSISAVDWASRQPTGTARTRIATSGTSARRPPSSMPAATSQAPRAPGRLASTEPSQASTCRPATASHVANALLTQEWTPLEPGVLDHKLYVRGIGTVLEQTEKGGNERNELV